MRLYHRAAERVRRHWRSVWALLCGSRGSPFLFKIKSRSSHHCLPEWTAPILIVQKWVAKWTLLQDKHANYSVQIKSTVVLWTSTARNVIFCPIKSLFWNPESALLLAGKPKCASAWFAVPATPGCAGRGGCGISLGAHESWAMC